MSALFRRAACRFESLSLLLVLAVSAGCNKGPAPPKTTPVTGKVMYKGAPVSGAQVAFVGDGKIPPAIGITDLEGKFTLTTVVSGDGAVPGEHRVTVSKMVANPAAKKPTNNMSMEAAAQAATQKDDQPATLSLLPERYGTAAESDLRVTVKDGPGNDFTIELKD